MRYAGVRPGEGEGNHAVRDSPRSEATMCCFELGFVPLLPERVAFERECVGVVD
jgi:hypothetical protein